MRRLPEEQHVDDAASQSASFVFRSDFANADEICIVDRPWAAIGHLPPPLPPFRKLPSQTSRKRITEMSLSVGPPARSLGERISKLHHISPPGCCRRRAYVFFILKYYNNCQTNCLNICRTDFRQIFRVGRIISVDDRIEMHSIPQGKWPLQPIFVGCIHSFEFR